jgi:hypothetical protein
VFEARLLWGMIFEFSLLLRKMQSAIKSEHFGGGMRFTFTLMTCCDEYKYMNAMMNALKSLLRFRAMICFTTDCY